MTVRSGVIRGYSFSSVTGCAEGMAVVATPDVGEWVEAWLSAPRFRVYLDAAGQQRRKALDLYEWNSALTAAFQHDLAHLEVGLRNAYDRALTQAVPGGHPHWVFEPQRHFPPDMQKAANRARYDANEKTRRLIADAVKAARSSGPATAARPPSGKVIAEMGFGFWRYLSVKRHDKGLWVPHLHKAFQPGVARRDVDEPVSRLHKLRNRVAHHEPLLSADLAGRCQDMLALARLISPELESYISANSSCPRLLTTRPC
jgi:hypothetical protein